MSRNCRPSPIWALVLYEDWIFRFWFCRNSHKMQCAFCGVGTVWTLFCGFTSVNLIADSHRGNSTQAGDDFIIRKLLIYMMCINHHLSTEAWRIAFRLGLCSNGANLIITNYRSCFYKTFKCGKACNMKTLQCGIDSRLARKCNAQWSKSSSNEGKHSPWLSHDYIAPRIRSGSESYC